VSYAVYILKSEVGGRFYIGSGKDEEVRVVVHNSPKARWTKRYQPWQIVHVEKYATRAEAVRRERYLKSLKGIGRHLAEVIAGKL
jgi:putative endonuclease